ncbi:hypothetical protein IAQ61_006095 [Plenodomus lingam]|uniref:uncharacterized protein n=1 Tax=Leptosphaeria maculans TaxID=5022 RepID=UPI00332E96AA|nr:hypothetical protein IAQ61_006095 [Plenodomus lingam]
MHASFFLRTLVPGSSSGLGYPVIIPAAISRLAQTNCTGIAEVARTVYTTTWASVLRSLSSRELAVDSLRIKFVPIPTDDFRWHLRKAGSRSENRWIVANSGNCMIWHGLLQSNEQDKQELCSCITKYHKDFPVDDGRQESQVQPCHVRSNKSPSLDERRPPDLGNEI